MLLFVSDVTASPSSSLYVTNCADFPMSSGAVMRNVVMQGAGVDIGGPAVCQPSNSQCDMAIWSNKRGRNELLLSALTYADALNHWLNLSLTFNLCTYA